MLRAVLLVSGIWLAIPSPEAVPEPVPVVAVDAGSPFAVDIKKMEEVVVDGKASSADEALSKAITDQNWAMAAGAVLMLLMRLLQILLRAKAVEIPKKFIPLVTLAMAVTPGIALALMKPQVDWGQVVTGTLEIWVMASGIWGISKQVRRKPV